MRVRGLETGMLVNGLDTLGRDEGCNEIQMEKILDKNALLVSKI